VVFVPYAAPGDRVQAEVVERRGGYLRARVAAVLVPGPGRVLPGCRYFPTCGGCQWQHVAPPAQRDATTEIGAAQLARWARVVSAAAATARPGPADLEASEALLARAASVRGTVVAGAGARLVAGDPTVRVALEPGLDLEVPADVFTQVNPGANRSLVETVAALGAFAPGTPLPGVHLREVSLGLALARRACTVR